LSFKIIILEKTLTVYKMWLWNIPAFHYRHININHPEDETWIDQEEDGENTKILEAGTGDDPNP
jgi:hypothetical protein